MPILPCPFCKRDVLTTGGCCSHCGSALEAAAPPVVDPRTEQEPKAPRIVKKPCPRCQGAGKLRDKSLLPWNNMAALMVVLGVTGLIGAAYLDENRKALLLGGTVSSIIGIGLYIVGEPCPRCRGEGSFTMLERPKRQGNQQQDRTRDAAGDDASPSGVTRVKLGTKPGARRR